MESTDHKNVAALLALRFLATIILVWVMTQYLDGYFYVGGGWGGYTVIAALITLLNFLLRPVLKVILLPLRFFATFLAIVAANAFFLWVVHEVSLKFDSSIVTLDIRGFTGWLIAGVVFGVTNWLFTH